MAPADLLASVPQFVPDAPGPRIGTVQMDLIDEAHQLPVFVACRNGRIVDARAGEVKNTALLCQRQWMSFLCARSVDAPERAG